MAKRVIQNIRGFSSEIENKNLRREMRNALRKEARRVRNVALRNLKATGIHYTASLAKGVRSGECRKYLGIYVSVRSSLATGKGFHVTKRGRLLPILRWFADGTDKRYGGRNGNAYRGFIDRNKYGGWMDDAQKSEGPKVERNVMEYIEESIMKKAKKYGFW